jgi:hypothetical protein
MKFVVKSTRREYFLKDECSGNVMYSCMKMEKLDMLKLLQEWGGIKENDGGEFTYDIF